MSLRDCDKLSIVKYPFREAISEVGKKEEDKHEIYYGLCSYYGS